MMFVDGYSLLWTLFGGLLTTALASNTTDWSVVTAIRNQQTMDQFGRSLSLSSDGSILAIGSPDYDSSSDENTGVIRIYDCTSANCVQMGNDIEGEGENTKSGRDRSLSLSPDGDKVAVGGMGSVGSFLWDDTSNEWTPIGATIYGDVNASDYFGSAVAFNGTVLVVGDSERDVSSYANAGQVRVYRYDNGGWTQMGDALDGPGVTNAYFGDSVALSMDGSVLAVGARGADRVSVFSWNGASWTQWGTDLDGESGGDDFGMSLSLSSNGYILAVGAPDNASERGHARVYEYDGTQWIRRGEDIAGALRGDHMGYDVSLSSDGSVLAVGATQDSGSGCHPGYVRVLSWDGSSWAQTGADIWASDISTQYFGHAVSLSSDGSVLAVGDPFNDNVSRNAGSAMLYRYGTTNEPIPGTCPSTGGSDSLWWLGIVIPASLCCFCMCVLPSQKVVGGGFRRRWGNSI